MALTSTLFTGLSGLDVNQTRLNVVGNNIANVNTVAFKSSRALFKPQFYVTDAAGSPPGDSFGGTNPSQRGLGATVSAIEKDWSNGAIEPTGRMTDMAIDGNGFFVVQGKAQMFTRDGSFTLNSANELVTQSGDFVQGFGVDANYQVVPGQLGNITVPLGAQTIAEATENVKLVGNLDASGDVGSGASILLSNEITSAGGTTAPVAGTLLTALESVPALTPMFAVNDVISFNGTKGGREVGEQTFTVTAASTLGDLMAFMQGGLGIDATFTPAGAPTPGVTVEPGVTANSIQLGITGNVGTENALAIPASGFLNQLGTGPLSFTEGSIGTFTSNPTGESISTSFVAYDSLGTPVTINVTAVMEAKTDEGVSWRYIATSADDKNPTSLPPNEGIIVGTGTLQFDNFGRLKTVTGNELSIDRDLTGAGTPITIAMNFEGMTSLTSRSSEMVMTEQDGSPIGTLDSFSVGADGTITGSFTNGRTRTLGQLALATFNNPQGLVDQGGNMFIEGSNSGVATITAPLKLSAGSIRSGALELSNVDLSEQFINMIISTTGFSAASRVISTSDRLIQELLNTSR
jgi:flagellar hook protein FlgE